MKDPESRGSDRIDQEWSDLSRRISEIVIALLKDKGSNKSQMAREIGYAQSAISDTLNATKPKRRWSFPLLMLVAEYLKVPMHSIIKSAEDGALTVPWLQLHLAKTPPASMDRLDLIVKTLAPEKTEEALLSMFYTAQMLDLSAPDYVNEYVDGKHSDEEVYQTLQQIDEKRMESEPPVPLWAAVKNALSRP